MESVIDSSAREPALAAVIAELWSDLHRIASVHADRNATMSPTAVVNEVFLKLNGSALAADREHLLAIAAKAIRQVLVDYARSKNRAKRGGGQGALSLNDEIGLVQGRMRDGREGSQYRLNVLALDEALTRLAEHDPRQAQMVELRFFGGLSEEHAAAWLGVSRRTVQLEWQHARAWLARELDAGTYQ